MTYGVAMNREYRGMNLCHTIYNMIINKKEKYGFALYVV